MAIPLDQAGLVITGAGGQLGSALQAAFPAARAVRSAELDISDPDAVRNFDWQAVHTVINAAAYTAVDAAETNDGRSRAWAVNAEGPAHLAEAALTNNFTLVHVSSEYVFDGRQPLHGETEPFSPLSAYGASKAAGDIAVRLAPKHYVVRTSWVIGEGKNFVRTMLGLAAKGVSPSVVADQIGRLTFTDELVRAISHLLTEARIPGTYNVTGSGEPASWADITRLIFQLSGHGELSVADTTTADYFADKPGMATRPLQSTLDLAKLQATGFEPHDWRADLETYVNKELQTV